MSRVWWDDEQPVAGDNLCGARAAEVTYTNQFTRTLFSLRGSPLTQNASQGPTTGTDLVS